MPFSVLSSLELEDDAALLRGPSAPAAEEQEQYETAHEGQTRTGCQEGQYAALGVGGRGALLYLFGGRPAFDDLLEVVEILVDHHLRVGYDPGAHFADLPARRVRIVHRHLDAGPLCS